MTKHDAYIWHDAQIFEILQSFKIDPAFRRMFEHGQPFYDPHDQVWYVFRGTYGKFCETKWFRQSLFGILRKGREKTSGSPTI